MLDLQLRRNFREKTGCLHWNWLEAETREMLLGTCYTPDHPDAMKHHHHQLPATSSTSRTSATSSTSSSPASSTSLFTIDSILAPRPSHPSATQQAHVLQSHQRLPPAVLHHPLHLGHLAAAAASGFGATSADFLGKLLSCSDSV